MLAANCLQKRERLRDRIVESSASASLVKMQESSSKQNGFFQEERCGARKSIFHRALDKGRNVEHLAWLLRPRVFWSEKEIPINWNSNGPRGNFICNLYLIFLLLLQEAALQKPFSEWWASAQNWLATWSPRSLMINYNSFYGTRKVTNHQYTRKFDYYIASKTAFLSVKTLNLRVSLLF